MDEVTAHYPKMLSKMKKIWMNPTAHYPNPFYPKKPIQKNKFQVTFLDNVKEWPYATMLRARKRMKNISTVFRMSSSPLKTTSKRGGP